jgi:hypothetical protein
LALPSSFQDPALPPGDFRDTEKALRLYFQVQQLLSTPGLI